MKRRLTIAVLVAAALVRTAALAADQAGATPAVALTKAAFVLEVTNDQRAALAPDAGQKFLWVAATLSGAPETIDLTKVSVVSGTNAFPLLGVDSAYDGEPKQFSMIAPAHLKGGKLADPLEETRSVGFITFAFTPGKTATLKVNVPPQSFCLLFGVPQAFRTGQIKGLTVKDLPLPALATAKP